jgi:hypothetical protein
MDDLLTQFVTSFATDAPAWVFIAFVAWFGTKHLWPYFTKTITQLIVLLEQASDSLKATAELQKATTQIMAEIATLIAAMPKQHQ